MELTLSQLGGTAWYEHQEHVEYIQQYHGIYNMTLNKKTPQHIMECIPQWTDQNWHICYLFIMTTAVIIGVDIHITSEHCTRESPCDKTTSLCNDVECCTAPPLLIGNIPDFLLPLANTHSGPLTDDDDDSNNVQSATDNSSYNYQPILQ